jgi:hypothetical protein
MGQMLAVKGLILTIKGLTTTVKGLMVTTKAPIKPALFMAGLVTTLFQNPTICH